MASKVLIIGAGGMLGDMVFQYLKEKNYYVVGITKSKRRAGLVNLDVTDESALLPFLDGYSFDVIINCAALLVGASTEHPADAVKLNAWVPHVLAQKCACTGTYLVQVSTDGIFSGRQGGYCENDISDASTFYGKSKYLGELDSQIGLTVRSGFWGCDINAAGSGLFQWFMNQSGVITGYTRALFNGVSNLEFAKFLDQTIQNRWLGIYHLCAADTLSKYAFLELQKQVFIKEIEIHKDESTHVDRTLCCTRTDIPYRQKKMEEMMYELKEWIMGRSCYSIHMKE